MQKIKIILLFTIFFSAYLHGRNCEKIKVEFLPFIVNVSGKNFNTTLFYTGKECDWSECFLKYQNLDYVLYHGGEENFTSFQSKNNKMKFFCVE